jgi:hypothetical protein
MPRVETSEAAAPASKVVAKVRLFIMVSFLRCASAEMSAEARPPSGARTIFFARNGVVVTYDAVMVIQIVARSRRFPVAGNHMTAAPQIVPAALMHRRGIRTDPLSLCRMADGIIFGPTGYSRHRAPASIQVQTTRVRRPVPGHSNEIRIERLGLGKF